jgi:magnesium transporter
VYVYLGICSIMGSFTVISCKAVAIALKLTYGGHNQFVFFETYFFALVRSQTGCLISIRSCSIVTTCWGCPWQEASPLV